MSIEIIWSFSTPIFYLTVVLYLILNSCIFITSIFIIFVTSTPNTCWNEHPCHFSIGVTYSI